MNIELINELRNMSNKIEDLSKITDKIIQDLKSKKFPIPIVKIMRDLGFWVGVQELDDNLSGYIVINKKLNNRFGKDKLICVNVKDHIGRQRFTIAHELAHYIFDFNPSIAEEYYSTYRIDDIDSLEEQRANKFAANLLMPADEFEKIYNKLQKDIDNYSEIIEELCRYFEVSKRAIERRIIELGLE